MVLTPLDESRTATDDGNDGDADLSIDRMGSRLPSSYEADPETIYIRKEQLEELYATIHSLSPRHHAWIICRYGFDDDVYKSLVEMGRIYHLSESRAKRTEDEAIGNLRKELTFPVKNRHEKNKPVMPFSSGDDQGCRRHETRNQVRKQYHGQGRS